MARSEIHSKCYFKPHSFNFYVPEELQQELYAWICLYVCIYVCIQNMFRDFVLTGEARLAPGSTLGVYRDKATVQVYS